MRASREQLKILFGTEAAGIRGNDWSDLRSLVVSLPAGTDLSPLLQGLPSNLCPCPHWGYVIKGQMQVSYADRQEVIRAGDLFYLPRGHTGLVEEDFECVEFSRPAEHEPVMDVVRRNAAKTV